MSNSMHRRVLGASLAGTAIEFYDFYIYATAAALVFPSLFFGAADESVRLFASFATMGIAFIARPLGGLIFGHLGDRVGRKSTLVASLLIMGGSTTLIALLPTYQQAGWIAPALLALLRVGQGIGLGGEWGGASLLAVENAPAGWRYRFGIFPPLGAPLGFIMANGLFLGLAALLDETQFLAWGWRIPFLLSAVLVAVGLWVRLKVSETPAFQAMQEVGDVPRAPIRETLVEHTRSVVLGTLASTAFFVLFYVSTSFALSQIVRVSGMTRDSALTLQLLAILALAASILLAGWIADKRGARLTMILGGLCGLAAGALFAPLFGTGNALGLLVAMAVMLFAMGLSYGTAGGWLPSLFPARVRYTGTSIAFNLAGVLGGALAPMIAEALTVRFGLWAVGGYVAAASLLSLIATLMTRDTAESR